MGGDNSKPDAEPDTQIFQLQKFKETNQKEIDIKKIEIQKEIRELEIKDQAEERGYTERMAKLEVDKNKLKLDHEETIEKIKAGVAEKDKDVEIEKFRTETKRIEAEQKMKNDEIEANMKKVQLEFETETIKKKLEEETKLAKLKEEEKRFRLIILLTALGFFFVLTVMLLIYLNSGSMVCYGDACFGYQGHSSKSETIPKTRRLGENGKLLLTGSTTNKQDSKIKLTTIMASAFLATSIIFVLFDLTIQDRKMLNHIGNLVSLYMKSAEDLLKDSRMLNNTRNGIAKYTERTRALARRNWNILLQTEAVKNIIERF